MCPSHHYLPTYINASYFTLFTFSRTRAGSNDDLIETSRTYPFCTCILLFFFFFPFRLFFLNSFWRFFVFPFLMITNRLT
ncbi:hypothetical protein M752DRAFT_99010 [Aspergillus phoenicis ATCC 13157]|uniref:Uncharacterized protein n=1 Tax=Aspergillus phoenicis ATCC 13157 TaxID=1353007 RepID=A0A370PVJ8_ASPPH|nr:hypothetical protein M752DRAFT_99010 [Aspergillus phoenicis ATCC 13157]